MRYPMIKCMCVTMMMAIMALGGVLLYYSIVNFQVQPCTLHSVLSRYCDNAEHLDIKSYVLLSEKLEIAAMINPCSDDLCTDCQCNVTVGKDYHCWDDNHVLRLSCRKPLSFIYIRMIPGFLMVLVPIIIFIGWLASRYYSRTVSRYTITENHPLSGDDW